MYLCECCAVTGKFIDYSTALALYSNAKRTIYSLFNSLIHNKIFIWHQQWIFLNKEILPFEFSASREKLVHFWFALELPNQCCRCNDWTRGLLLGPPRDASDFLVEESENLLLVHRESEVIRQWGSYKFVIRLKRIHTARNSLACSKFQSCWTRSKTRT